METNITQQSGFGKTDRRDSWWAGPLATALVLGAFVVYATIRGLMNRHYEIGPYLSPFYSPKIILPGLAWLSPAFLILWGPAGFRLTCYYYRKAYYRAYFADPPACAVGEFRKHYKGETRFPFLLQNIHRYFLYAALVILFFLWLDVYHALWFDSETGGKKFGVGLGTIVLLVGTCFLTLYTFSCHSLRHLIGGKRDCFGCPTGGVGPSHGVWKFVSKLNERHMLWAWCSLFAVQFADFYVWMVASGRFVDIRIF